MAQYQERHALRRKWNVIAEVLRRGLDFKFIWYRFRWNWVADHDLVLDAPLNLDIELTEACNLACVMCVHGTTGVPITGRLDVKLGRKLLDQAAEMGVCSVKFNWRGEPALHTGLESLVAYAKKVGIMEVQINTNGIPYTEKRIEKLIDAGIDRIIVSIDGASKKSYEAIRVGSDWNRLIKNVKLIHEIRTSKGQAKPFIRIQMVHMKENAHEVEQFVDMWKDIADDISIKDVSNRGQGSGLFAGNQIATGRRRCNQPWQRMVVARDGKVFPCCSDWDRSYEIGDARETSLTDIWHGRKMEDLRDINRQARLDEEDLCRNCIVETSYEWRKMTADELAAHEHDKAAGVSDEGRFIRADKINAIGKVQ